MMGFWLLVKSMVKVYRTNCDDGGAGFHKTMFLQPTYNQLSVLLFCVSAVSLAETFTNRWLGQADNKTTSHAGR